MLSKLLIAFCLMALCVAIHAMGLTAAFRWLEVCLTRGKRSFWPSTWTLVRIATWTVLLHLLQILAWAFSTPGAAQCRTSPRRRISAP